MTIVLICVCNKSLYYYPVKGCVSVFKILSTVDDFNLLLIRNSVIFRIHKVYNGEEVLRFWINVCYIVKVYVKNLQLLDPENAIEIDPGNIIYI